MRKTKRKNKVIILVTVIITIILLFFLAGVILLLRPVCDEVIYNININNITKNKKTEEKIIELLERGTYDEFVGYSDNTIGLIKDGYEIKIDDDFNVIGKKKKAKNTIRVDKNEIKITCDGKPVKDGTIDRGTPMKIENIKIDIDDFNLIIPLPEGNNPYSYTTFGTENEIVIKIIEKIKKETHIKLLKISLADKYKEGINHSEVIVPTIEKLGNFKNPNISEVRQGNIPIPIGYTYIKGDVKGGAVIKETDGEAEFVWVPVGEEYNNKNMFRTEENGNKYGILYDENNLDKLITNIDTNYEKSETLKGDNNQKITIKQIQNEFNEMAASVEKYGGFYVGRYESSLNNNILKPIKGKESVIGTENSENSWYELYTKQKAYKKGNIKGNMIWGCQWDAMCKWMKSNKIDIEERKSFAPSDITGNLGNGNRTKIAGNGANDKLCNIYDLLGSNYEWTLEANNTSHRVYRGGLYFNSGSPALRNYFHPTGADSSLSTRATLYIQ